MLVDLAPPVEILRTLHSSFSQTRSAEKKNYLSQVLCLHEALHGPTAKRGAVPRAERRDAGVPRAVSDRPGPETEVAFARKREAGIALVLAAGDNKRARLRRRAPLGLAQVAEEAAAEAVSAPSAAAADVQKRIAKRKVKEEDRCLRGAQAAAKARAKRGEVVTQSKAQPFLRDAEDLCALRSGVMLVRFGDEEARRRAQRLRFELTSGPGEFVRKVAQVPASAGKGHVVLAPLVGITDYTLSARIAAVIMGGYAAAPEDFIDADKGPTCGIMYREKFKSSATTYHVALTDGIADEFPTLPQLLRAISLAPGSCIRVYKKKERLFKFIKKEKKKTPRILQRTFVIAKDGESTGVKKTYRALCISPLTFTHKFDATRAGCLCPGFCKAKSKSTA